jgi:uncharacterized membrane protein YbhN (UPF0104 family)
MSSELLGFCFISLIVWLLLRSVVIWYFKIDKIVDELRKQNETLIRIAKQLDASSTESKDSASNDIAK